MRVASTWEGRREAVRDAGNIGHITAMRTQISLDDLWSSARSGGQAFDSGQIAGFPERARRYLEHAIAAGTPLASAVRLHMHGEIKLRGWCPFSAEQVINWSRGMIWRAAVRMRGLSIRGSDSFVDGQGTMRWKLFGLVPIVNAGGPDIARSAASRVNIESVWLPSALCSNEVSWTAPDACHAHARFTAHNETAEIDYAIGETGQLRAVWMPRWGNPDGPEFGYANFGGVVEHEGRFCGYTIPTRMRVGWHFNTERFESEGEFFRVTLDDAAYL
jgi:uncharacterized protein DUF6920